MTPYDRADSFGSSSSPIRLQTCNVCKDRKVRCDRAHPKCGRCVRLRLPCGYTRPQRWAQDDLPRQLSELQDRLSRAEARLDSPGYRNPSPTPGAPEQSLIASDVQLGDTPSVAPEAANHDTHRPVFDAGQGDAQFPSSFENDVEDLGSWPLDWAMTNIPIPPSQINGPVFTASNILIPIFSEPDSVSEDDLRLLHQAYFDVFHITFPFVNRGRFNSERRENGHSYHVLSLSYAIALIGSTCSPQHSHLQRSCYRLARKYMELCEQDDNEAGLVSLNHFQALLLVIKFELAGKIQMKAWMTLGRALRLAKMLELHKIDQTLREGENGDSRPNAHSNGDLLMLEERRRSFWGLYILESYASTQTGLPSELEDTDKLDVCLPSLGSLDTSFVPRPTPILSELVKSQDSVQYEMPPYAGSVLMVELALRCFRYGRRLETESGKKGFWDDYYLLIKEVDQRVAMLRPLLNAQTVREDPLAFALHLNLSATEIFFHEVAITQVSRSGLPVELAKESKRRSAAAAFKIASAIRLNWTSQRPGFDVFNLQATFIGWPLTMAMKPLSRDLGASEAKATTSIAIANSIRLLLAALDRVEERSGHWHKSTTDVVSTLQSWDERSGFEL